MVPIVVAAFSPQLHLSQGTELTCQANDFRLNCTPTRRRRRVSTEGSHGQDDALQQPGVARILSGCTGSCSGWGARAWPPQLCAGSNGVPSGSYAVLGRTLPLRMTAYPYATSVATLRQTQSLRSLHGDRQPASHAKGSQMLFWRRTLVLIVASALLTAT